MTHTITSTLNPPASSPWTSADVRVDFPILTSAERPVIYLDNAATSQKPDAVIAATTRYYKTMNANIHRGVYRLSVEATDAYESARAGIAAFIGAGNPREVVFTRGCTEAINLVAMTWGLQNLKPGSTIVLTQMEHHSNIVPWQLVAARTGAKIVVTPVSNDGELDIGAFERLVANGAALVAVTHISNVLGTINPVQDMARIAHRHGALILVDGAQSVAHMPVHVGELGCDFFTFSGHKMCGPTGIGALWARGELLDAMPPYQGGGDMISTVSFEGSTWNMVPHKFEAGTPDIAGAIGLGAAVDYLKRLEMPRIATTEADLLTYAEKAMLTIPGLRLIGQARHKASVISFMLDGIHPHDIGTILDQEHVAIRTGHHCCQPLMDFYHIPATARASLAFYNTQADIDALISGLRRVIEVFR
jgi:cysteine desulfurase/selenocysteine lyase